MLISHGELMLATLTILETRFVVAEAVVFLRLGKNVRVLQDGVRSDTKVDSGREMDAVGEGDWLTDDAVECHFDLENSVSCGLNVGFRIR